MSETNKLDVQQEELNIASAPEQAVNAATTDFAEEQSNEQPVEEQPAEETEINENSTESEETNKE